MFEILMSIIQIENLSLREHTIKIMQLLLFVSPEFAQKFSERKGFKILASMVMESKIRQSFNFCHTILNVILQTYDNPNDLRPANNALV
jgi:hypothetical protein